MHGNKSELDLVRKLAMRLPDIEESTIHGAPSWKLNGKLLTCPAIHKSAEPNSLLVKVDPAEREELLSTAPEKALLRRHVLRRQSREVLFVAGIATGEVVDAPCTCRLAGCDPN